MDLISLDQSETKQDSPGKETNLTAGLHFKNFNDIIVDNLDLDKMDMTPQNKFSESSESVSDASSNSNVINVKQVKEPEQATTKIFIAPKSAVQKARVSRLPSICEESLEEVEDKSDNLSRAVTHEQLMARRTFKEKTNIQVWALN